MLGIFLLISLLINGYIVHKLIFKKNYESIILISSFIIGSTIGISIIALLLLITKTMHGSLIIYSSLSLLNFLVNKDFVVEIVKSFRVNKAFLINLFLFLVSFLVFQKTFSFDSQVFSISSNLYQDFGAHVPFIRYFSQGQSIFEVPFFANGSLTYHFMFDFYAGLLEYLGLKTDFALNLISSLAFVIFINILFRFSKLLTGSILGGVVVCVLFIFNSDLSFIQLIQKNGLSLLSYYQNNVYTAGNILGMPIEGNFLNINVIANQRHLIYGLGWMLYIIYLFIGKRKGKFENKETILIAALIGVFPFWHLSILVSLYCVLTCFWIAFRDKRAEILKAMLLSLIFVIPQLLIIKASSINEIRFNPGFMVASSLSPKSAVLYWVWNLGFAIPLAMYGFLVSNSFTRKIVVSFFALFLIANLFQFSSYMFDNHKFFNVWIVSVNILCAMGLLALYKKRNLYKVLAVVVFVLITISGFLNLLVIKNDTKGYVRDYSTSKIIKWVKSNTNKESVFLTNGEIYDPISVSGGRIFLGRSHYIYLYGGNPDHRIVIKEMALDGKKANLKKVLNKERIDYIIIYKGDFAPQSTKVDWSYLDARFNKVFENAEGLIYKI